MKRASVMFVAAVVWLGFAGPAVAHHNPYHGTTTSTTPQPTNETQNGPRITSGGSATVESCGFLAGDEAAVTWEGQPAGSVPVGDDGCADVVVAVSDSSCPDAVVNGTDVSGTRGKNDLAVAGPGSNGAPRTVTTRVTVTCSGGPGQGSQSQHGGQGQRGGGADADAELELAGSSAAVSSWALVVAALVMVAGAWSGAAAVRRRRASH